MCNGLSASAPRVAQPATSIAASEAVAIACMKRPVKLLTFQFIVFLFRRVCCTACSNSQQQTLRNGCIVETHYAEFILNLDSELLTSAMNVPLFSKLNRCSSTKKAASKGVT
jgi:hypothetical protein